MCLIFYVLNVYVLKRFIIVLHLEIYFYQRGYLEDSYSVVRFPQILRLRNTAARGD